MIAKSRLALLAIATGALIGGAVYAADVAYRDRTGSGVQKPTVALTASHGRTPKNAGAPIFLAEVVPNYDEPAAVWRVESTAFDLAPGWRLRPAFTVPVAAVVGANNAVISPAVPAAVVDGYCVLSWEATDRPAIFLRGNLRDVAARFAVAQDGDLVAILFDLR